MTCKNCGEKISVYYCTYCGQHSKVSKLTFAKLLNDIPDIFQVNKGFLYTAKELSSRPGHSIREYLLGKRMNHFKPLSYLLLCSTLYFLMSRLLGENTWMSEFLTGIGEGLTDEDSEMKVPRAIEWFADNYAYTNLLLLPVFSFSSYLCFKRYKANYIEHLVLNSYLTGHQAIIYTIFTIGLITIGDNDLIVILTLLAVFSYCLWAFLQLFNQSNKIGVLVRLVLTYIVYIISWSCLLFIIVVYSFIT